jgi:rhomboid protease GluP
MKTRQIVKRIKRKTLSFKINTLSLFLNLGDNVDIKEYTDVTDINLANIKSEKDLGNYNFIIDYFPDIEKNMKFTEEGLSLFMKLTGDINQKNEGDAKMAEDVFTQKNPIITKTLIAINVFLFFICSIYGVIDDLAVNRYYILNGEYYRLITGAFMHANIFHLLFNCYALYIIGSQLESFLGKFKYTIVYFFSALSGSLMSILFTSGYSVGASGAIFGLMGSLLYFGYHYRIYLGTVIRSQIIPLIVINLLIGLMPGIDNWAHIGGLIGGTIITIALGIKYKSTRFEMINGFIISGIYLLFLLYMIFVRGF